LPVREALFNKHPLRVSYSKEFWDELAAGHFFTTHLGVSIDEPLSLPQPFGATKAWAASARLMPRLKPCRLVNRAAGIDELIKKDTD
jgi:hypothetical protein